MKRRDRTFWPAVMLAILGLLALACSAAAPDASPQSEGAAPLPTQALPIPTGDAPGEAEEPPPSVPENRLLVLEWPSRIRVGDSEVIRLSLEMDTEGRLTPTAEVSGNEVRGEPVEIPNLYETHNVLVSSRLDISGLEYQPAGEVSQALRPGQPVTFYWSVRPPEVGDYRGVIWLHLRFLPLDGRSAEQSVVLSSQRIEIQAVNFLGLGGAPARLIGSGGALLGSLLSLDSIVPWLWRRVRPKSRSQKPGA